LLLPESYGQKPLPRPGAKAKANRIAAEEPQNETAQKRNTTTSDIDDCQTPCELLASFVAASVSSVGLKSPPGADLGWKRGHLNILDLKKL